MVEAIALKLLGAVVTGFLKRYWKPLLFGAIGLAVFSTLAIQHWRITSLVAGRAEDHRAIADLVTANAANIAAIDEIKRGEAIDRQITADGIARAAAIAATAQRHIQEIQNDPGANDPAGAFLDALGDRLRDIDQSRHPDPRRVP